MHSTHGQSMVPPQPSSTMPQSKLAQERGVQPVVVVVELIVVVVVVSHTPAAHIPPSSQGVPSGCEASGGHAALVPVQFSATSQSPVD
jgi:hypothetical protein